MTLYIGNCSIEREIAVYTLYSELSMGRLGCIVYSVYGAVRVYSVYIQDTAYTVHNSIHPPSAALLLVDERRTILQLYICACVVFVFLFEHGISDHG